MIRKVESELYQWIFLKVIEEHMDREIKPENNGGHIDFEILKAKPRPIIVKYIRCNARNII